MRRGAPSLRMRLTVIILLPILLVSLLAGAWQLGNARSTAAGVFDRSLLSAALAVARDVTVSGGDALSERTRDILADTSGGTVFYHVYAPDGVIVAGYATPPVGISRGDPAETAPAYFDAVYLGKDVRGVRLLTQAQIDGFSGVFTTTVWQDSELRAAFVRELMLRPVIAILGMIMALALIVWFGVRLGLRPLLDLEQAIEARSGEELSPIQRAVPGEVEGIVSTLNRLFGQVSRSMAAQSEFISNAAHQLRNPIAGVLSLAEAIDRANSPQEVRKRSRDLLEAARETAELSQNLLLLERAKEAGPAWSFEEVDLDAMLADLAGDARRNAPGGAIFEMTRSEALGRITADPTMLREAIRNLIDNAYRHGGPTLSKVTLGAHADDDRIVISVTDDGVGLPPENLAAARARFVSFSASSGGGLGVSIADAVARGHGGDLVLAPNHPGLAATISLPRYPPATPATLTYSA